MGYECLLAGLPDLKAGSDAPISMEALELQLSETLTKNDKEQLRLLKHRSTMGACQFVKDWLSFNMDLNNVLTAQICRKHGFDVRKSIIGDNEVARLLKRPESQKYKDFGLNGVLDNAGDLLALAEVDNLMEREKRQDAFRFLWLEEKTRFVYFTLENVLAYYLMAEMLNRWAVLTVEQGEKVFRDIVSEMKAGVHFDD